MSEYGKRKDGAADRRTTLGRREQDLRSTFDRKAAIALARNILANVPDSYTEEQLNDIGTRARHWVWGNE